MSKKTIRLYAQENRDYLRSNIDDQIFDKQEIIEFLNKLKKAGNLKDGHIKTYLDATIKGKKLGKKPTTYTYYLKQHPEYNEIILTDLDNYLTTNEEIIFTSFVDHAIKIKQTNNKKIMAILAATTILTTGVLHQTGKLNDIKEGIVEAIESKPIYESFESLTSAQRMLVIENKYRRDQKMPEINMFGDQVNESYNESKRFHELFKEMLAEHEKPNNIDFLWDLVYNGSEEELKALTIADKKIILNDYYLRKSIYNSAKEIIQNEITKGTK
jgi:RNAse (barnase) inhibitor barstar